MVGQADMENGNFGYYDYNGQYGAPKRRHSGGVIAIVIVVALLFGILFGAAIFSAVREEGGTAAGTTYRVQATGTGAVSPLVTGGLLDPGQSAFPNITPPVISDQTEPAVEIYEKMNASVVLVRNYNGTMLQATGSGVIFTTDGYIITNQHVVEDATALTVVLSDEKTVHEVLLVGVDERSDLAVLKIKNGAEGDFQAASLGNSAGLKVGQTVIAIGSPLGLSNSITQGIISGLNRAVDVDGRRFRMIQTDCALNPGNSGGPLFDRYGQVIGIVERKEVYVSDGNGGQIAVDGMSYAIPIDTAKTIVEQLMQFGEVKRAGLGIRCGTAYDSAYNPLGVEVASVTEGGPCAQAGVKAGDLIIAVDGEEITMLEELTEIMESKVIGQKVTLKIVRNNTVTEFVVDLGTLQG